MPLIQSSSKQAFEKNIAQEIASGKGPAQAAAIAYSIQRANDAPEFVGTVKTMQVPDGVTAAQLHHESLVFNSTKNRL